MQNYRDPPPYPGHSKQVFPNQPGFRQSFSGSEASTDVSLSSTENLATSQRQEPQGEETQQSPFYHNPHQYYYNQHHHQHVDSSDGTSSYSILARLGMPPGGLEPSSTSSIPSSSSSSSGVGVGKSFGYNSFQQQKHQQQDQGSQNQIQIQSSQYDQQHQHQHHHHNHHHHHPVSNSSVPVSSSCVGESNNINMAGSGNSTNISGNNYHYQHHQVQHHSIGGNFNNMRGGQQHHYSVMGSDKQNFAITGDAPSHAMSSGGGADPLYSHGNQLTVPQWKVSDGSSGSRKNSGAGLYLQQQHIMYNDSQIPSSNGSSSGALIKTRMESSSTSAFSSSILLSSSSTSSSSSSSSPKTFNHHATTRNPAGMILSSSSPTAATSITTSSSTPLQQPSSSLSSSSSSSETVSSLGFNSSAPPPRPPTHTQPGRMADYVGNKNQHPYLSPRVPPVSTYHHPHPYVNAHYDENDPSFSYPGSNNTASTNSSQSGSLSTTPTPHSRGGAITPSSSSSSSTTPSSSHLPPPPYYPGASTQRFTTAILPMSATTPRPSSSSSNSAKDKPMSSLLPATNDNIRPCRSYETIVDKMDKLMDASLTHHPDIRLCASSPGIYVPHHCRSPVRSANASSDDGSDQVSSVAAKASRMVDVLTEENRALRDELATATVKVNRLSKFEVEVHKMHDAHESLLESHQKRETLWLAMRRKLEERIRGLEEGSRGDTSKASSGTETDLRARLAEKESLISRLMAQNQELLSSRNQLETENIQLNLSLAEQRARVDIVEKALVNCQAKVLMGDEEYQKKISGEVAALGCSSCNTTAGGESRTDKQEMVEGAGGKSGLDQTDKLKATYLKETSSTICIEEASKPLKEVRLAALEKNSSDVEKLIDEAKTEKLKHMEELHESNKRMAELDAKVKQLQSQLVEKEAMVKVFQRSPYSLLPRSSSLHALCHHSPLHSPRPSLIASQALEGGGATSSSSSFSSSSIISPGGGGGGGGGSHKEFSSVRHMKTGSTSAIDMGRKMSIEEDLLTKVQGLGAPDRETKDDSMEEVRLWHV